MPTQLETTGSAAALNADVIPLRDTLSFDTVTVQISGVWVGQVTFQMSNDNVTWANVPLLNAASGGTQVIANSNGLYYGAVPARYFRARMTSYTSGTATGIAEWNTESVASNSQSIGITSTVSGGGEGDVWNAAAVGTFGVSSAIGVTGTIVTAFGTSSAATTITLQVSQNGTNWYNTGYSTTIAGAGDFFLNVNGIAGTSFRLMSSAAATITGTIMFKGA